MRSFAAALLSSTTTHTRLRGARGWAGLAGASVTIAASMLVAGVGERSALASAPLQLTGQQPFYGFSSQSLDDRMGISVNVASGNLLVQASDLHIAGTQLDLAVARFYNSQSGQSTDFGGFWTMGSGADVRIAYNTPASGDATFYGPSGYAAVFTPASGGGFTSPPALEAVLTHNGDGSSKILFQRNGETYNFNTSGQLATDVDRNQNTVTYTYSNGRLCSITDTRGRTLSVQTNGAGQITQLKDSSARVWAYGYTNGDLTSYTDPNGKQTGYQYTGTHLLSQIADPNGNVTQISYASSGQVASISRAPALSGGAQETTSFAYASAGSACPSGAYGQTTLTDPDGHNTIYCYDSQGRVLRTQDPDGHNHSRTWSPDSQTQTTTSPGQTSAGVNTSLTYNNNALTSISVPTGASGNLVSSLSYDTSSGNPNPYKNFFPASSSDPQNNTTSYTYDGSGNMTAVKDQLGRTNHLAYNLHGQVTGVTDADSHSRSYGYDASSQLTTLTPPQPSSMGTTTIGYDGVSRVISVTDGKQQKRTYRYDGLDRILEVDFADASKENYSYDCNGNLLSRTDTPASGTAQTTSYTYDALNRLTKVTYPNASSVSYGYDAAGNLQTFADAGGTVTYHYDPANLLSSLVDPVGTTSFGYDSDNHRTSTTYPGNTTESVSYTNPATGNSDPSGRIYGVSTKNSAGTLLTSDTYAYTAPTSGLDTTLQQSVTDNLANKTVYSYDNAEQLTRAQTTNSSGATTDDYQYTYDAAGNHTSQNTMLNSGSYTQQTLTYNADNQLCWSIVGASANACSSPPIGATQFSYDANGNELGATGQLKLTWNAKDQMTSEQDNPSAPIYSMTYLGTGQGERTQDGITTFENSALGITASTTSGTTTYYTRDPDGSIIDGRKPGGTGQFFILDGNGNTIGLASNTGTIFRSYKYGPDGGVSKDTGSGADTLLRYHQAWNGAGNMYHYGARDYDPILREWTQPDPLDQPSDLQQANGYAYVGNDPVNAVDAQGLAEEPWGFLGDMFHSMEAPALRAGYEIGGLGYLAYNVVRTNLSWSQRSPSYAVTGRLRWSEVPNYLSDLGSNLSGAR